MNVIKDGGGTAAMRDKLNKDGEVMKVGMQKRGKKIMKEVHLQFCCLISSSINYKQMQPRLLKSLKGLLLGPPSLFPRKVISFHTPRVNMAACRQTVFAGQLHYSPCSFTLSTHLLWKQQRLECLVKTQQTNKTAHPAQTQCRKKYSMYAFYSKHSPSWFICDFECFPSLYRSSLSKGGVPLICSFSDLGRIA